MLKKMYVKSEVPVCGRVRGIGLQTKGLLQEALLLVVSSTGAGSAGDHSGASPPDLMPQVNLNKK